MMVGRFVTSTIKNLTSIGDKLISGLSVLSVVTIVLMILAPSPVLAIIAVVLTGLAFAPIFPTIVGVTFAKFEPKLYGSVFGIIFAVGLLGGTFVPKIIGKLSEGSSVQQSLPIAAVMAGIMFIVSLFIGRIGNPERK
jgi:fucose permease